MTLDEVWILWDNAFIKEFLYSVNDEVFYYNVLTKGGDELVYKYNKEEHKEIQYLKECYLIRRMNEDEV